MFSGGEYEEVARWLRNFVASHAKRENLRAEPVGDTEGPRAGGGGGPRGPRGRGRASGCACGWGPGSLPRRPRLRSSSVSRRWRRTGGASRGAPASRGACAHLRASCPRPGRARSAPLDPVRAGPGVRWWAPGDWNAFCGLALDSLSLFVILSGLLIGVFGFPSDLVLRVMVPG